MDPPSSPNLDSKANAKSKVDPKSIAEEPEESETKESEEVRRKVEKMTYEEGAAQEGVESKSAEKGQSASLVSDAEEKEGNDLKRKALERSQSSFNQEDLESKRLKDEVSGIQASADQRLRMQKSQSQRNHKRRFPAFPLVLHLSPKHHHSQVLVHRHRSVRALRDLQCLPRAGLGIIPIRLHHLPRLHQTPRKKKLKRRERVLETFYLLMPERKRMKKGRTKSK